LRWAPVFASAALVLAVLNTGPRPPLPQITPDNFLTPAAWSNQNLAPFADAQSHSGKNFPPIIHWTNVSFSFLSNGSFLRLDTNR